ncbi:WW domain-containing oxidoreductase [Gymnopilus junonius]|uniref:WW domain-containing oxidoreductase n=1 Tax=Gymnopilus junonius TaxID=109634 RepID=A0A9P5NHD7_GYMJU|nr:WW domain-containing oxidoreductase [Gymnopilus junonius]
MPSYDTNTTSDELVKDYASLIKGKVVLTTGVSPGGLGAAFVLAIAKAQPALLILAGRDLSKVEKTAAEITSSNPTVKTRNLRVDLESLQSVREAAAEVNSWADVPVIDVIVNNAAVMAVDYALSVDGFERHLASNHLGHFLLTNLVINKVLASKSPRVVFVSSAGHRFNPFRFDDYNFDGGKSYDKFRGYGQSKTANILTAVSLAKKLGGRSLLAFSLHPGVIVKTNLVNHLDLSTAFVGAKAVDYALGNREGFRTELDIKSTERGIATHIYAAFDPNLADHNGSYLLDCHVGNPVTETVKPWAISRIEAEKLWTLSEKLVGQEFNY